MYKDYLREPKIVIFVDRWSLILSSYVLIFYILEFIVASVDRWFLFAGGLYHRLGCIWNWDFKQHVSTAKIFLVS